MYKILSNWITLTALLLLPGVVFSQENNVADSLARLLKRARIDTVKVNLLNDLAWELKFDNPQQAIVYLDSALSLSRKLNFKKGEGNAYNFRGVVEDIHGNSEAAIDFFQKALAIRESLGDRKGVASLLNNIGNVRENRGDYLGALQSYQQSLKIREELQDTARILRAYYNIAIVLESMGDYPAALDNVYRYLEGVEPLKDETAIANAWNIIGNIKTEVGDYSEAGKAYNVALQLHRKQGNDWQVASVLNNIANLNDTEAEKLMDAGNLSDSVLQKYKAAIALHEEALEIRKRLEDTGGQAEIYNNIGYVLKNLGSFYKDSGNLPEALKTWDETESYFQRSLEIREAEGDRAGIMEIYNGIADVRRRQQRYPEALDFTKRYYEIAKEIKDVKFEQNGLKDLARIYFKMGEYKTAYEYREAYDELRYARFNEERIQAEAARESEYASQKIQWQEQELKLQEADLQIAANIRNSLIGGAALLLLLALVLFNRNKIIRTEKQRSENLLLNILPAQTAEELKTHGKAKARRYDAVTVLFSDFKSFTQIAEQTTPEELVAELDECFQAFDEIATRYGIEKIKTIGDAYLCAGGLPVPTTGHAGSVVRAALDMQQVMLKLRERQRAEGKPEFHCRIGIHTGPVVAGVVGKKKFAYDIWGDTVNMAARMEQSGEANRVNISQSTYELVKDQFQCTHRGKISAKNKGEVDMYFVEA